MNNIRNKTIVACALAIGIVGCSADADDPNVQTLPTVTASSSSGGESQVSASQWTDTSELNANDGAGTLTTALSPSEIPYPVYPNGYKYRIGGQGDLKIILFQTEDSFEEVDAYYQKEANMPRLSAMSDYVRYSTDKNDIDPWETSRPGIVIHQFNDETERKAVGADGNARTNIIMSF
ncbi:MAG: hypothetical protein AB8B64_15970 [Granulosicoccus sp.]